MESESDRKFQETNSFLLSNNECFYDHSRNNNRKKINRRRQIESTTVINKPIEEYQVSEVFPGININAPIKINRIKLINNNIPPEVLNENKTNVISNIVSDIYNSLNGNVLQDKNKNLKQKLGKIIFKLIIIILLLLLR